MTETQTLDITTSNILSSDWTAPYSSTSDSTTVSSNYYQVFSEEPSETDVFKQIVSLLGIKIVNVSIKNGKVILYGKRNKKKFVIEIENNTLTVKGEKGDTITVINLYCNSPCSTGSITVTPTIMQPYVYPVIVTSPNTAPQTWHTVASDYNVTTGTFTISEGSINV